MSKYAQGKQCHVHRSRAAMFHSVRQFMHVCVGERERAVHSQCNIPGGEPVDVVEITGTVYTAAVLHHSIF